MFLSPSEGTGLLFWVCLFICPSFHLSLVRCYISVTVWQNSMRVAMSIFYQRGIASIYGFSILLPPLVCYCPSICKKCFFYKAYLWNGLTKFNRGLIHVLSDLNVDSVPSGRFIPEGLLMTRRNDIIMKEWMMLWIFFIKGALFTYRNYSNNSPGVY